jgi:hypothetical protein
MKDETWRQGLSAALSNAGWAVRTRMPGRETQPSRAIARNASSASAARASGTNR